METTATAAAANTAATTQQNGLTGGKSLYETFDNFLTLLTEQLKNQDPLSPMESNEFTSQLVEFTGAEQAVLTNTKLDSLISLQNANQLNSIVSYIGKTVTANSLALNLDENGATIKYSLGANAKTTEIKIIDEDGNTVRTLEGQKTAGSHELVWDGKNEAGDDMDLGLYGFLVTARDGEDKAVETTQGIVGEVTGIETDNGQLLLAIGDLVLPLSEVGSIRATQTAATASED